MSPPKPLVVVASSYLGAGRVLGWAGSAFALPERYVTSLGRAGARSVLLPPSSDEPATEALAPFDGLVLAGGGDVEPTHYGAPPHPESYGINPERDDAELRLARAAMDMGIPVFAICRGLQVLNVALGGTLHQHLPDIEGLHLHGHPVTGESVVHDVKIAGGTQMGKACGCEVMRCTSHHHQGVDRLGAGLTAVAWSDDGLVEGVEADDHRAWVVGVQWHPETTSVMDPSQQALFDAFVAEARARAT